MALTQSYGFLELWKRSQLYTSADLNILPWFYLKDHLLEASQEDTRNDCGGLKKSVFILATIYDQSLKDDF